MDKFTTDEIEEMEMVFETLLKERPELGVLFFQEMEAALNKGRDYGADDTSNNLTASLELGIEPWVGCVLRMNDKMARIKSFIKKGMLNVKDESVTDSLKDLSVYAKLAIILFNKVKEPQTLLEKLYDQACEEEKLMDVKTTTNKLSDMTLDAFENIGTGQEVRYIVYGRYNKEHGGHHTACRDNFEDAMDTYQCYLSSFDEAWVERKTTTNDIFKIKRDSSGVYTFPGNTPLQL